MKGIVLAGGLGTRLHPFTQHDNKHLLPVYDKRMVEFPLRTLIDAGIDDIILITGGHRPGKFLEIFKNGKSIGANRLYYTYQEGEGGIADALKMARPFMRSNESCAVILGDNYFEDGIRMQYKSWNKKRRTGIFERSRCPAFALLWNRGNRRFQNCRNRRKTTTTKNKSSDCRVLFI